MKVEDSKDGDVTPINSLSDENKPSSSKRKLEPTSEVKPNLSRVTPAQLQYISFPSDGRYQPVRTVTSIPSAKASKNSIAKTLGLGSDKFGGGGGILILTDSRPDEEAEFIDLETPEILPPPPEVTPAAATAGATGVTGPHISLDESSPDAAPPEPFEVSPFYRSNHVRIADCSTLHSILSTMTLRLRYLTADNFLTLYLHRCSYRSFLISVNFLAALIRFPVSFVWSCDHD